AGIPLTTSLKSSFVWAAVAILVAFVYQESPAGLRLRASRENEAVAETSGVRIHWERWLAFVISALLGGMGGAVYSHFLGAFSPDTFSFSLTFLMIAMLVIGGIKSLSGAVVGTIAVSTLSEGLRHVEAGFTVAGLHVQGPAYTREVGLAISLLLILIYRPRGITQGRELGLPSEM